MDKYLSKATTKSPICSSHALMGAVMKLYMCEDGLSKCEAPGFCDSGRAKYNFDNSKTCSLQPRNQLSSYNLQKESKELTGSYYCF